MKLKTFLVALAALASTASVAMADVSVRGGASAHFTFGTGYSSYEPRHAPPVVRDHRGTWRARQPMYRGEWYRPAQPLLSCSHGSTTVLATAQLGGTKNWLDSKRFDLRHVRGIDQLTFAWVYGNTSIKQVMVTYMSGQTELFNIGDSLTQGANHRFTRTIDVRNEPISHIAITGYAWGSRPDQSTFQLLAEGA